eukprot:TRINITY_DN1440_c0_g3_i2.p1 TRINITY_DN1440_c0_g3~~TRINITY_DN1440_c0_g3_i2.p1  ORF type:complete len:170 (+),score=38.51 TRINITY_DN1440_c0_g3_i2:141-650(+)
METDLLYKLIIIGDSEVGKTNILTRYVHDTFNESYLPTIGVDFGIKTFSIKDKTVKLQIWDTAGQERFRTITTSYYSGCAAAIVVYDITNQASFENIQNHVKFIRQANPAALVVAVGNKTDLSGTRVVKYEDEDKLSKELEIQFFEVSAKTGDKIQSLFETIADKLASA